MIFRIPIAIRKIEHVGGFGFDRQVFAFGPGVEMIHGVLGKVESADAEAALGEEDSVPPQAAAEIEDAFNAVVFPAFGDRAALVGGLEPGGVFGERPVPGFR